MTDDDDGPSAAAAVRTNAGTTLPLCGHLSRFPTLRGPLKKREEKRSRRVVHIKSPTSNFCSLTFRQQCKPNQIYLCISLTLLFGHRLKLFWLLGLFFLLLLFNFFVTLLNFNLSNLLEGSRTTYRFLSFFFFFWLPHCKLTSTRM